MLLEYMSLRISHHSTSDDSFAYRTHHQVDPRKTRDNPVMRLRKWLELKSLCDELREKTLRSGIGKSTLQEMKAAREKKPPLSSVWDDVYAEHWEEQESQKTQLKRLMMKYPTECDVEGYEGGIEAI